MTEAIEELILRVSTPDRRPTNMTEVSNLHCEKNVVQYITSDRISNLPIKVINEILKFLPLRDAVRTSILSSKWRHRWAHVPQVVFDDTFFDDVRKSIGHEFFMQTLFEVLLLHSGPIHKFKLSITEIETSPEIDRLILFLSRKGIQDLELIIPYGCHYKLPSYAFSCLKLRCLKLCSCIFEPPPMFKGFRRLVILEFHKIQFESNAQLEDFINMCPLLGKLVLDCCKGVPDLEIISPILKSLIYVDCDGFISFTKTILLATASICGLRSRWVGRKKSLVDFFINLSGIEYLSVDAHFMKAMVCDASDKLPAVLNHLKVLQLYDFDFGEMEEVLIALCLLRVSPNLRKLLITFVSRNTSANAFLQLLESDSNKRDFSLNHLQEVELIWFRGTSHEVELIKLLLAKSSTLKMMKVALSFMDSNKQLKCFKDIMRLKRASAEAEIIVED